jgi:micrococcal nuclease
MAQRRRPAYLRPRGLRAHKSLLLLVAAAAVVGARWWQSESRSSPPESLAEGVYRVERVIDGDTLLLTNHARVRLIGVDTPETVKPNHPVEPWGPEASEFTKAFIAKGAVRLQFDRERLDRYDRFLAYVLVDDRMLNEELVRAGLATAETKFSYSTAMKNRFRRAEDEARAARRGIWSGEN